MGTGIVTWATDPKAKTVPVYYFGTSTVYEGMPVCYDNSTTNWTGSYVSSGVTTESATTAEGLLNEGKFIRVENPNADNISLFAGVVAGAGKHGVTGPCVLDIFVPNGAVVPVRTDSNCLIDQTVLAITTGSQELGVPLATDSRPVAIARETVDRGTAGLVLAELNPGKFLHQDMGGTALSIDDADTTTASMVNHINLNFLGSATSSRGLYAVGQLNGGGANYGMWKFRTYINAQMTSTVHTLCANLHIKDAGQLVDAGEWASAPMYVTVETEVTTTAPTLSGGSLAGIYFGYYVDESTAAPAHAYLFQTNNHASYNWDGILRMAAGDLGDSDQAGTGAHVIGFDGDGDIRKIPVLIDGTTYYLLVGTAAAETDD